MNISNVSVRLTEEDILSIVRDFLKIEEIKIESICIKDNLYIKGKLKKGIKLNFQVKAAVHSIKDNILMLKILSIKLGRMPISIAVASFIIKKAIKSIEYMGITIDKGFFYIDFKKLCNYIPSVSFTLLHITTLKGGLEVELKNLVYSESKQALSLGELKEKIEGSSEKGDPKGDDLKRTEDKYTEIRGNIKESIPTNYKDIGEYFLILPDIIALLYRLMKDKRVPTKTKLLIGGVIGYLALPLDIVPDFIPLVGKGDDFGIAFLVMDKIIEEVPKSIIIEHWQGNREVIYKFIDINNEIMSAVGRKNALKILSGAIVFLKRKKRK